MRTRLRDFLPVAVLALAIQVLAPIVATWAVGFAFADPLQNAIICTSDGVSSSGQVDKIGAPPSCAVYCTMCCLAQAGTSLDTPRANFLLPVRDTDRVAWHVANTIVDTLRRGANAQARAPPFFS